MILAYRQEDYKVPLTSKCIIHTTGTIRDGDLVSVTSPVFASTNFISGAINTSERFSVPVKILREHQSSYLEAVPDGYAFTGDGIDIRKELTLTGETYGILHCEDNDTFNMYVSIQ